MSVAAQITQDMLGFMEGRLGIDDPDFVGRKAGHQAIEGYWSQFRDISFRLAYPGTGYREAPFF